MMMMMINKPKNLPKRLQTTLASVVSNEGDDIDFVLGYLNPSTARSYMSQLKKRGLAYTHSSNGTTEVWAHPKGRALFEKTFDLFKSRDRLKNDPRHSQ